MTNFDPNRSASGEPAQPLLRLFAAIRGPSGCSASESAGAPPLTVTFDAALEALARLPRLFIEPDGSFVWRGATADAAEWQLDGNLIDRGAVLDCVQLLGNCPPERLDDVLHVLGWPAARLSFELPRLGIVLEEAEFRRLAVTQTGAG